MGEGCKPAGRANRVTARSAVCEAFTERAEALVSIDVYVDRTEIEAQAHDLIEHHVLIGAEYKNQQTYRDDGRTALFEALTAKGHLSKVELSGTLEDIHQTMLTVLLNTYHRVVPGPERDRNFQELCSELTRQAIERRIVSGELPPETEVAEVTDFIEGLSDEAAKQLGYRALNKKGFVRSSRLIESSDGTFVRVTEQISRSNARAARTEHFLESENLPVRIGQTADVRVLGAPFLHTMSEGVVGVMKRLDAHQGVDIMYGEQANDAHIPYENLREESLHREWQAESFTEQLAVYTEQLDARLAAGEITPALHEQLLKHEIRGILRAICTMRPEYAQDCFGEEAARTYYEASDMAAAGDAGAAASHIEGRQHLEQAVTLCGLSISSEKAAKDAGVPFSALEQLIKHGLENWPWTQGVCRVDECPTKPGRTMVGPCSVCRGCQNHFDHGVNPARLYRRLKRVAQSAASGAVGLLFSVQKPPQEEFKLLDFSRFKEAKDAQMRQKHETIAA